MNYVEMPGTPVPVKMWTNGVTIEQMALQQIRNTAELPIVEGVAVMPDSHWGNGAPVGTVVVTFAAIPPAPVGVDLGCGMRAVKVDLQYDDIDKVRQRVFEEIEAFIPVGGPGKIGSWEGGDFRGTPKFVEQEWLKIDEGYAAILEKHPKIGQNKSGRRADTYTQLGTLGTGNHFIEICHDETGQIWFMLHSGSRGVGNRIGSYFIDLAREQWLATNPRPALGDPNLAWFNEGTDVFDDYVQAVGWAQDFAKRNRELMMQRVFEAVERIVGRKIRALESVVDAHHNYVSRERVYLTEDGKMKMVDRWVTRKGAISARAGELGIIPGSMGARSYIVRGKGNPDSFFSSSHGAGRAMSRGHAKRTITLEQHQKNQEGIACRATEATLDEAKDAYKPIEAVMAAQADLTETVATLQQMVVVKG